MFEYLIYIAKDKSYKRDLFIYRPNFENTNYFVENKTLGDINIQILYYKEKKLFYSEDESKVIILNGSVYLNNYNCLKPKELIADDLLNKDINSLIINLNGHFQIIEISKSDQYIKIYNDRFGLLPAYYGESSDYYLMTNSLSVLKNFNPDLDENSLVEKLIFEHNLGNNTIFKNIFTLEEGSILHFETVFRINRVFSWYEYFANASNLKKFNVNEFINCFNALVNSKADRNRNNLVTLTGGHDGRAVCSSFIRNNLHFSTFSFGRPGSENTIIPETISKKLGFHHQSVYLESDFEKEYFENAYKTIWLSDGELPFTQQSTYYSIKNLHQKNCKVFTGLLAGEVLGPVHLLCDYINPEYYKYIYEEEGFSLNFYKEKLSGLLNLNDEKSIEAFIKSNIMKRINNLKDIKRYNPHLLSLADMITWGFRKFYGYQMHLIRYYLENIPIFYDFDLINYLVYSDYNVIYKNSYKSLYKRRNSRKIQIQIINYNSKELSKIPLDRGYTPHQAINKILLPAKLYLYFKRKLNHRIGNFIPDFLRTQWVITIFNGELKINETYKEQIKNDFIVRLKNNMLSFEKLISNNEINYISQIIFFK